MIVDNIYLVYAAAPFALILFTKKFDRYVTIAVTY